MKCFVKTNLSPRGQSEHLDQKRHLSLDRDLQRNLKRPCPRRGHSAQHHQDAGWSFSQGAEHTLAGLPWAVREDTH